MAETHSERITKTGNLRECPKREGRFTAAGRESARSGKYKEDDLGVSQRRDSRRDNARDSPGKASPLKTKPSGRGEQQLGHAQTEAEIAKVMECHKCTISHELAYLARSNYFQTSEEAQRRCGKEVDSFRRAFEVIEYPFDLSSTVLGREFCWDVRNVIEESQNETPRPKKWELCERILDRCEHTWSGVGVYSDVGPPYWPPDFNDHINRLFERGEGVPGV